MVIILTFICTGCATSVKADLVNYAKFEQGTWKELETIHNDFFGELTSRINNKQDRLEILKKDLKKFTAAAEKQKQYKPQTREVQNVHKKFLKILDISEEVFYDMVQAEEHNSLTQGKADELRDKYHEAEELAKEYRQDVEFLRKNYL